MGFPTKNDVTSCSMMLKSHLRLLVKMNRTKVILRIQEKMTISYNNKTQEKSIWFKAFSFDKGNNEYFKTDFF